MDWVAKNRDAQIPLDPNNEQLQRECALGRTTDFQDPMHGKGEFPWPRQLPPIAFHEKPEQRVLHITWSEQAPVSASIHAQDRGMGVRLESLIKAGSGIATLLRRRHNQGCLTVQVHDEDPQIPCLRLDASNNDIDDPRRPLIPDPYCLMTDGYRTLRERMQQNPLPPWNERLPMAFWRGSTTGSKNIDPNNLALNRRYQLTQLSRCWPDRLDARFNRVVQCRDATALVQVKQRLQQEKLLGATVTPWHAGLHAWQIDIDGNVNSWGLLWKLLSGSCILRVQSPRRQWYHKYLQPWEHLVPVQADLSDLDAQLDWCFSHLRDCAAIAEAGQALALQVVKEIEDDLIRAGVLYAQAWM